MNRKLVIEALGTFFLVFTIGMVVIEPGAGAMAPLAIGVVLMVMIYAGGHISGGHYNPAVTLAVFLRGKATAADLGGYWIAQVLAAIAAAAVVGYLKPDTVMMTPEIPVGPSLVAEFLFTFALAFVVLNVATARGNAGNSFFGLAIGGTVLAGAYAVGGISGGAFNPAVAVGLVVLGVAPAAALWIYLVANLLGGAAAGLLFNALDLGDDKAVTASASTQAGLDTPGSTGP